VVPVDVFYQATKAGAFVQAVGKAAVAAHQGLKV
jgi:hypothetical protein